jgi:hypothetical protein
MRTQIWMIAGAFAAFGIIAWIVTGFFSPAWIGLMGFGVVAFVIGLLSSPE